MTTYYYRETGIASDGNGNFEQGEAVPLTSRPNAFTPEVKLTSEELERKLAEEHKKNKELTEMLTRHMDEICQRLCNGMSWQEVKDDIHMVGR